MGIPVPFGEWLPDLPEFENNGATVAKNVTPDFKGYRPFPSLNVYSTSLGGKCIGAFVGRDIAGNYFNYAGDASALYQLAGVSWTNSSRLVGGAYGTAGDDFWEFTQFGELIIGVNGYADDPQVISAGGANFAALGGAPTRAKHIATVRDFVVMGNLSGGPQDVRWCAINNATSWTADPATLADFQRLPGDHGHVQKVIGGEYGTVMQERAIYRMTFVGSPLVFQFDKVQTNLGAYAPQSCIGYRNTVFFLSEDGFQMFDGVNVVPIGAGKIDRTFFNDLDANYFYRVVAEVDPVRKIVAWAYPSSNNTGGNPDRMLLYHWPSARWSRIEDLNIEFLRRMITGAVTLDGLDSFFASIDAATPSLDSNLWITGQFLFSAFNSGHRLAQFAGSAMAATVETPEVQLSKRGENQLAYVTKVRPLAEGLSASYQCAVGSRLNLTESVSFSLALSPVSAGFVEVRNTNRYHRFRLQTTSATEFTYIQGVDVIAKADGER